MFGSIARRYDLLNHLLSLNLDRSWRRRTALEIAAESPHRILDLCGGTGDLSLALARACPGSLVVCCDFSHPMLAVAERKFARTREGRDCAVLEADGLRLPFAPGSFDAVTVAFGIRNFVDMDAGLRECLRVLRRGGRLAILEFSTPTAPVLSGVYRFYLTHLLPWLGDRISGREGPYGYLARTISSFPDPPALAGRIREAGFAAAGWTTLTGGVVAIHTAIKS
jgi:demethylmenaquinone methyltransferase/2-methoxy-6-polyprenyl-1,4-benzoquinol methylase